MATAAAKLDDTLMALADPTRRAILLRLTRGEARVTDLAEPFDLSLNAVSKHIRVLERARLVQRRRVGREHWLARNSEPLDDAIAWMSTLRQQWSDRLDRLERALDDDECETTPQKETT
jgi:DNA-binding transcriptional ArsR family regulator